ncbi:MAG: preprotein translocase subunit YajC [Bacteroidetes bacterium]|nr:preprotein translocase subunit YajC [Bacteroidota bacterium]
MTQQEGSNPMMSFVFLILIFVIFYFFMIRPQVRKQKELTTYRNSLQKGDKVITTGGIYGRILDVKDNIVTVDVGGDVKLRVDKSAILKDSSDLQQQK